MPSVTVKGLRELSKQFENFDKEMHSELKGVLKDSVKGVAKGAKDALSKGHGVDTGEYRRSISWRVSKSGVVAWAFASRRKMSDDKTVSNRGYIGHLLEYGTIKGGEIPHFGPAMEKARSAFPEDLRAAVRRIRGIRL